MPGKVKVKIVAGRNLPVMDRSNDTTDAYVEVKLGSTTFKTEVCRKSLNPQWDSEWFRFEMDDLELQDEPLQIRLMDHDTYSANDAIGKVYLDLNPLLLTSSKSKDSSGKLISGWIPVYDTMHGIRGDVSLIVKVELFSDLNKFRQSSCGVKFFFTQAVPDGYFAHSIHGFVEELVVNDDPEYQWIDKIRTPRASNEARQTLFSKLSGEVQRKVGLKALELGGNAVIGYRQCFDLEGESGIVVRGIGTAATLVKQYETLNNDQQQLSPSADSYQKDDPFFFSSHPSTRLSKSCSKHTGSRVPDSTHSMPDTTKLLHHDISCNNFCASPPFSSSDWFSHSSPCSLSPCRTPFSHETSLPVLRFNNSASSFLSGLYKLQQQEYNASCSSPQKNNTSTSALMHKKPNDLSIKIPNDSNNTTNNYVNYNNSVDNDKNETTFSTTKNSKIMRNNSKSNHNNDDDTEQQNVSAVVGNQVPIVEKVIFQTGAESMSSLIEVETDINDHKDQNLIVDDNKTKSSDNEELLLARKKKQNSHDSMSTAALLVPTRKPKGSKKKDKYSKTSLLKRASMNFADSKKIAAGSNKGKDKFTNELVKFFKKNNPLGGGGDSSSREDDETGSFGSGEKYRKPKSSIFRRRHKYHHGMLQRCNSENFSLDDTSLDSLPSIQSEIVFDAGDDDTDSNSFESLPRNSPIPLNMNDIELLEDDIFDDENQTIHPSSLSPVLEGKKSPMSSNTNISPDNTFLSSSLPASALYNNKNNSSISSSNNNENNNSSVLKATTSSMNLTLANYTSDIHITTTLPTPTTSSRTLNNDSWIPSNECFHGTTLADAETTCCFVDAVKELYGNSDQAYYISSKDALLVCKPVTTTTTPSSDIKNQTCTKITTDTAKTNTHYVTNCIDRKHEIVYSHHHHHILQKQDKIDMSINEESENNSVELISNLKVNDTNNITSTATTTTISDGTVKLAKEPLLSTVSSTSSSKFPEVDSTTSVCSARSNFSSSGSSSSSSSSSAFSKFTHSNLIRYSPPSPLKFSGLQISKKLGRGPLANFYNSQQQQQQNSSNICKNSIRVDSHSNNNNTHSYHHSRSLSDSSYKRNYKETDLQGHYNNNTFSTEKNVKITACALSGLKNNDNNMCIKNRNESVHVNQNDENGPYSPYSHRSNIPTEETCPNNNLITTTNTTNFTTSSTSATSSTSVTNVNLNVSLSSNTNNNTSSTNTSPAQQLIPATTTTNTAATTNTTTTSSARNAQINSLMSSSTGPNRQINTSSHNIATTVSFINRRSSESDLSVTPKPINTTATTVTTVLASSSQGKTLTFAPMPNRRFITAEHFDMMEYPFITLTTLPPRFIQHLGGTVSARSVKLLERISNLDEPESRDAWWNELRMEIRSHARAIGCNVVLGYEEHTTMCDDVCVLSASGTAAVVSADSNEIISKGSENVSSARSEKEKTSHVRSDSISSQHNGYVKGGSKLRHCSSETVESPCSMCHIPYNEGSVPFPVKMTRCLLCKKGKVPDILLATVDLPASIQTYGKSCLIQAQVYRPKRDCKGEISAKEVSDSLPFLEYELHRRLINKLKVRGMNAIFALSVQICLGEKLMVGLATGTAVFISCLPPPSVPKISAGNLKTDSQKVIQFQKVVQEVYEKNREIYNLKNVVPLPTSENTNTSDENDNLNDEDLPDIDLATGNKDTYVLEVDDAEDIDIIQVLIDQSPELGFYMNNINFLHGFSENYRFVGQQMFTQVWRCRISPLISLRQFTNYFDKLLQAVAFKLRRISPCVLSRLRYRVELPEQDEMQLLLYGLAVRLEEKVKNGTSETQSTTTSKDANNETESNNDPTAASSNKLSSSASNLSNAPNSHSTTMSSTTTSSVPIASVTGGIRSSITSNSVGCPVLKSSTLHPKVSRPIPTRPRCIEITPLSHIPGAKIEKYLGNLNFFFIRETTSIRESGGLSGFVHNFVAEVLAIVRAHVSALGGNAMVSYFMTELALLHNPHKNQGQCLVNVGGDVCIVVYANSDEVE